ncbi:hypothetical protein SNEBB_006173, partial [Seison nebaliae]
FEAAVVEVMGTISMKPSEELESQGISLSGDQEIEIIIGMDYYWYFVEISEPERIRSNLVKIRTIFGPIVSGRNTSILYDNCHNTGRGTKEELIRCFDNTVTTKEVGNLAVTSNENIIREYNIWHYWK